MENNRPWGNTLWIGLLLVVVIGIPAGAQAKGKTVKRFVAVIEKEQRLLDRVLVRPGIGQCLDEVEVVLDDNRALLSHAEILAQEPQNDKAARTLKQLVLSRVLWSSGWILKIETGPPLAELADGVRSLNHDLGGDPAILQTISREHQTVSASCTSAAAIVKRGNDALLKAMLDL